MDNDKKEEDTGEKAKAETGFFKRIEEWKCLDVLEKNKNKNN